MRFRPIFYVTGLMTLGLGLMMLPCALADILANDPARGLNFRGWRIFLLLSIFFLQHWRRHGRCYTAPQ